VFSIGGTPHIRIPSYRSCSEILVKSPKTLVKVRPQSLYAALCWATLGEVLGEFPGSSIMRAETRLMLGKRSASDPTTRRIGVSIILQGFAGRDCGGDTTNAV